MIRTLRSLTLPLMSICVGLMILPVSALYEQYQDKVVNGKVVSKGIRECASRYEALKPLFKSFKRRFTVLDLGANLGYFSLLGAYEYDGSFVMSEGDYSPEWKTAQELYKLCQQNTELDNIILLNKHLTVEDLEMLAEVEHFDVVLCFNVVHHFGKDWKRAADAIFRLGDYTIVESPPITDAVFANNPHVRACEDYLEHKKGKVIAQTPRHTDPTAMALMRQFFTPKTVLERKQWFYGTPAEEDGSHYTITSTFEEKWFCKQDSREEIKRPWRAGINFMTFKALSGIWPTIDTVVDQITQIGSVPHGDFMPWNIIIDGSHLYAIDDEPYDSNHYKRLLLTIGFAYLTDYKELHHYVLEKLYPSKRKNTYQALIRRSAVGLIYAAVSIGELVDKMTILRIKLDHIPEQETAKRGNVHAELNELTKTFNDVVADSSSVDSLIAELEAVNRRLWDIEDSLRMKESLKQFDEEFKELARQVYLTNDKRSRVKREINERLGSLIIEEKHYASY